MIGWRKYLVLRRHQLSMGHAFLLLVHKQVLILVLIIKLSIIFMETFQTQLIIIVEPKNQFEFVGFVKNFKVQRVIKYLYFLFSTEIVDHIIFIDMQILTIIECLLLVAYFC